MKKKMMALLMAGFLTFGMMGCQSGDKGSSDAEKGAKKENSDYDMTVGVALNDLDEAQSVVYSYCEGKCEELNIEFILANAAGSIDQQITDIENFITSDVDVIVVSALDSNAVVDVVDRAREAGILVVDYIMGLNTEVDVQYGYSFYDMAGMQAQYLIDYLEENPDETLQIGYIWGSNSMELCQTLDAGFKETLEKSDVADRCEIVVEATADWSSDKAITIVEDWMQAYPEMKCVVTQSDAMTVGAVEAIRMAGADPSAYITIGKDGGADACKSIAEGGMTCAIYCSQQLTGEYLAEVCRDLYDGKISGPDYQARITEFEVITGDNVADYQ